MRRRWLEMRDHFKQRKLVITGCFRRVYVAERDHFFSDPAFHAWEHLHRLKEHVKDISDDLKRKLHKHQNKQHQLEYEPMEEDRKEELPPFPRRWMLPSLPKLHSESELLGLYSEEDSDIIRLKEDANSIEISLDVHLYRAENLHVLLNKGMLIITGSNHERSADGRRESSRQFRKAFRAPDGMKKNEIKANLSADGILVVSGATNVQPITDGGEALMMHAR